MCCTIIVCSLYVVHLNKKPCIKMYQIKFLIHVDHFPTLHTGNLYIPDIIRSLPCPFMWSDQRLFASHVMKCLHDILSLMQFSVYYSYVENIIKHDHCPSTYSTPVRPLVCQSCISTSSFYHLGLNIYNQVFC